MQQNQDVKVRFSNLPEYLRKLVVKPQFNEKKFVDISLKSIDSLVDHVKTKTLLSLCESHSLEEQEITLLQKCRARPIVLVFCQPSQQLQVDSANQIYPYVPVAYCSWLESAGARCIPLPYNMNEGSVQFLLERCNGLLIPGGGSNLYKSYAKKQGYGPVTVGFQKIWRMINKLWQKGVYFPVWGTCLGLQMVLMAITNDAKILNNLNSRAHQLQVYSDYQNSKITSNMPIELKLQLQNKKLINFQHVHGISIHKFINNSKLSDKLKITGISKDKDGTWFCSMIQGKQNPIFLSQFHPEKQAFSWTLKGDVIHQKYSILLSQYYGQSFILECLRSKPLKKFSGQKQLMFYLIQQYRQIHTPQKMFKIYVIDYRYRYVDKQARKQLKNLRSISTSDRCFGSSKNIKQQLKKNEIAKKPNFITNYLN